MAIVCQVIFLAFQDQQTWEEGIPKSTTRCHSVQQQHHLRSCWSMRPPSDKLIRSDSQRWCQRASVQQFQCCQAVCANFVQLLHLTVCLTVSDLVAVTQRRLADSTVGPSTVTVWHSPRQRRQRWAARPAMRRQYPGARACSVTAAAASHGFGK